MRRVTHGGKRRVRWVSQNGCVVGVGERRGASGDVIAGVRSGRESVDGRPSSDGTEESSRASARGMGDS
jgi:hypothetical protein